ncbi:hypothetical protein TNCV_1432121 [Trichonephila clavipes]|nr:hypothetical protein TNCV_1432121 [Trichonephila clavipes]
MTENTKQKKSNHLQTGTEKTLKNGTKKHYKQTISSSRRRAKKKKFHLFEDFFSGIYISIHRIPPPYPPQRRINLPELGKAAKQGNSAVRDDGLFVPEEFMTNAKARGNAFVWASVMFQEEPRKGMMQLAHPPQPRHSDLYTNNERRMNAPELCPSSPVVSTFGMWL